MDGPANRQASTQSLRLRCELVFVYATNVVGHAKSAALFVLYRGRRKRLRLERTGASLRLFLLGRIVGLGDVCTRAPFIVALVTIFTPVFLVSATSVMCDVMMLALWLWALEF